MNATSKPESSRDIEENAEHRGLEIANNPRRRSAARLMAGTCTNSPKHWATPTSKCRERYAKLGNKHIARAGSTARELWRMMEPERRE
jgi:hypothetical protein